MNKPNIILIYADQMRYDATSCTGNVDVKTPHLERLAAEGVVFDNAFSSYPLCCPFRASLMTGKHAQGHGMYQNHFRLDPNQDMIAQMLVNGGYQTGYIGKWHLDGGTKPGFVPPERRLGFQHFVGFNRGHHYQDGIYYRETDQPYRSTRYEPDYQTDHFIEFLDLANKDKDKPFFGFLSYGPPHYPNDFPDYWKSMYDPAEVTLPHGVPNPQLQMKEQRRRLEIDCQGNMRAAIKSHAAYGAKKPMEPETESEIRQFIAEYYAMTSNIDFNVGRILQHLDRLGIADNTLFIFLSDHGDMLGQHGYYCGIKPTPYRAAMQVPLFVRYPSGFKGGQRIDAMVDVGVDTMVSILDFAGISAPKAAHGLSYKGVMGGSVSSIRECIMYQTMRMDDGQPTQFTPVPERGVRTKDWLYVRQPDQRKMLHDLQTDPHEVNNLVEDDDYREIMDKFDNEIKHHMQATGDDWNLVREFPPEEFLTHEEAYVHLHKDILPRAIWNG